MTSDLDVVVIGAGAAGLAAAAELAAHGLTPHRDFLVVDAEEGPGGTWRRAWPHLTVGMPAGVGTLPGMGELGLDYAHLPSEMPLREAVPFIHHRYEDASDLFVLRPARVTRVESSPRKRMLSIRTRIGSGSKAPSEHSIRARSIINATGHWSSPYVPFIPGIDSFTGTIRHVAQIESLDAFAGKRVAVVGAEIGAVTMLLELHRVGAFTIWGTPRPHGRMQESAAPPRDQRGFESRGAIERIRPNAIEFASGQVSPTDAIILATGFRSVTRHLAPLRLREADGSIRTHSGVSIRDPRVAFVGRGAGSQNGASQPDAASVARTVFEALEGLDQSAGLEPEPAPWDRWS